MTVTMVKPLQILKYIFISIISLLTFFLGLISVTVAIILIVYIGSPQAHSISENIIMAIMSFFFTEVLLGFGIVTILQSITLLIGDVKWTIKFKTFLWKHVMKFMFTMMAVAMILGLIASSIR